jgi:ATP-binding cassette subfamily C protein CydC
VDRVFIFPILPAVFDPLHKIDKPKTFDLQFNAINFCYKSSEPAVLTDFSLQLKSGKKVAVIGPTGSGISSLIQLMLRYRQPESGTITLSGQDLSRYRSEQCHDMIAVVPQHTYLFNSSIRENLLIANPSATQQQLEQACKKAQIHDFILSQPEGYDTWVGETGVKISGGQARRLSVARALLRDFELLILDEPGEGLDAKTEQELIQTLVENIGTKALLLITHSQTGLALMDEVIILEQGICTARGKYQSLIADHGYFKQLFSCDNVQ